METHDVTVMKRIGYVLFLIVILRKMPGQSSPLGNMNRITIRITVRRK